MAKRAILLGPALKSSDTVRELLKKVKLKSSDLRIGVDGGTLHWLDAGFNPDIAVGDWDSLPEARHSILRKIPHITLNPKKDRSDLYFALRTAVELGATELVALGVTGGRPDHHLAVLYDLSLFSKGEFGQVSSVEAIGPEGRYIFLSSSPSRRAAPSACWKSGPLRKGQLISVFALGAEASGVTLKGFRYLLKDAVLKPSSLGLSNVVTAKQGEVRLRKGVLLVIMPQNGYVG